MQQTIDFYFDFSSPYAYFASLFVDDLGVETRWVPYLMGVAMKETGLPALIEIPYKRDYALRDIQRTARLYDVAFSIPDYFPFSSVAVCRAFYALEQSQGHAVAKAFAAKAMVAAWSGGGIDLRDPSVLANLSGVADLAHALQDQTIKDKLRDVTAHAMARGCWGSPHFFVNSGETSEHFWGCDTRWQVQKWLERPW